VNCGKQLTFPEHVIREECNKLYIYIHALNKSLAEQMLNLNWIHIIISRKLKTKQFTFCSLRLKEDKILYIFKATESIARKVRTLKIQCHLCIKGYFLFVTYLSTVTPILSQKYIYNLTFTILITNKRLQNPCTLL
jgi:hypothetical protein